jgi:hypothetical protein
MKHSFVVSHPGTDVPCGALTDVVSANACGMPNVMAITKITISGNTALLCIFINPRLFRKDKKLVIYNKIKHLWHFLHYNSGNFVTVVVIKF